MNVKHIRNFSLTDSIVERIHDDRNFYTTEEIINNMTNLQLLSEIETALNGLINMIADKLEERQQ